MIKNLKINPALFLCTAFIIRILFINVGMISSLDAKQSNTLIKAHFSSVMKRRKHFEALNNSGNSEYSTVEICEEDSDNHNQFKQGYFFLKQVLNSLVAIKKESNLQKIPFYKYFSNTSSTLQVFRI